MMETYIIKRILCTLIKYSQEISLYQVYCNSNLEIGALLDGIKYLETNKLIEVNFNIIQILPQGRYELIKNKEVYFSKP